jgi:uncharacterized protein (DUF4415 family)
MSKKPIRPEELAQLKALEALPDERIDTGDIPEAPAENWAFARHGRFYRPVKQQITLRIDADLIAWFKDHAAGEGYQTRINAALRDYVLHHTQAG